MLPPDTYAGRVVLITGGGTGLGKAMALEFARLGAAIVIASRKPEHVAAGVEAVRMIGGRAIALPLDVRSPEQVKACFDAAEEALGPVDVLVNNAAGNFPVAAQELSANGWRAVTDIVLDGTFFCSQEFARRRVGQGGGGAVLNISVAYAQGGAPGHAHSAAAKAGVLSLTETLAVEWAPDGIRVNALTPGLFPHQDHSTDMRAQRPEGYEAEWRRIPALRVGQTHELGWAATYLCSPFAAYLTGHNFVLDGAERLRRSLRMPEFVPIRAQMAAVRERSATLGGKDEF
ncbi:NAD(P)-dependent dehydrogenase, short-chain alcohol dehydrogenase family [Variovorax sp. HW608]|uniref:SDR family oxidoreductase n=1 Tax=Variovorax sp. HW608 TaxID=1034889 RepID=UPI00081FFA81|nr:SDR family oxidoreductase [Variovorax sp. HW608]SCK10693.1 NAD(P)-dependent dehydrogenase, short-chain alcohol dehydrogenase family [Variovorax sp. HW608]